MEPEDHVNTKTDGQRRSPPVAQPQEDHAWWNGGLSDLTYFDAQFFENEVRDDAAIEPALAIGPYVQHSTNMPGGEWTYPAAGEDVSGPGTTDYNISAPTFNDGNTALVNELDHGDFSHIFGNMGHSGEQQTTANAPNDFNDPYHDFASSQVRFPDLSDNAPSQDPIFYNNYAQSSYTATSTAYMTQSLNDRSVDQTSMQLSQPPTSPSIRRPRRRRRGSTDSMQTPEPSRLKRQCAGCDKSFYSSKDPDRIRCTRCYDKHVKHTAGHTTYNFDPNSTVESAWLTLYPNIPPLVLAGDDVEVARTHDQDYCRRLVEAVSLPYTSDDSGSKEDQQRVAQQTKLNRKPFDSAQYRDDLVNARIRFLFQIALSYHAGGPSMYDTGGDNSGYGEDRTMKFSDRMERIIQLLTTDKDIAMDVIEGRGVTALVHNPNKYERRKRDNKKSNDTKQDLQEKGKQLHMLEAGGGGGGSSGSSIFPPPTPANPAIPPPISTLERSLSDSMAQHNIEHNVQAAFSAQFGAEDYDEAELQRHLERGSGMTPMGETEGGLGEYGGDLEGYQPARFGA